MLEEHRVDGLLIAPVEQDLTTVAALASAWHPHGAARPGRRQLDLCSVTVDDVRGGELAAGHLVELGHEVIGFVNGPLSIRQCADRLDGAPGPAARTAPARPALARSPSTRSPWTTAKGGRPCWPRRPGPRQSCAQMTS